MATCRAHAVYAASAFSAGKDGRPAIALLLHSRNNEGRLRGSKQNSVAGANVEAAAGIHEELGRQMELMCCYACNKSCCRRQKVGESLARDQLARTPPHGARLLHVDFCDEPGCTCTFHRAEIAACAASAPQISGTDQKPAIGPDGCTLCRLLRCLQTAVVPSKPMPAFQRRPKGLCTAPVQHESAAACLTACTRTTSSARCVTRKLSVTM